MVRVQETNVALLTRAACREQARCDVTNMFCLSPVLQFRPLYVVVYLLIDANCGILFSIIYMNSSDTIIAAH